MNLKRATLTLLATSALATSVVACGSTNSTDRATGTSTKTSAGSATGGSSVAATDERPVTAADGDRDGDFGSPDVDPPSGLGFSGHPAQASDRAAIIALVKRYYAAALAQDGAGACSLFYSRLVEAAKEDYGEPGGPSYTLGAKNCTEVATDVFHHYHALLAIEVPRLRVLSVLANRREAVALLGFGRLPERELSLIREGRRWRVGVLRDRELP